MATFAIEHTQIVERTLVVAVEAEDVASAIAMVSGMELDQEDDWDEVFTEDRISAVSQWNGNALVLAMTAEMVWGKEGNPSLGEDPQRAQAIWDQRMLEKNTSKAKGKRKQGRL